MKSSSSSLLFVIAAASAAFTIGAADSSTGVKGAQTANKGGGRGLRHLVNQGGGDNNDNDKKGNLNGWGRNLPEKEKEKDGDEFDSTIDLVPYTIGEEHDVMEGMFDATVSDDGTVATYRLTHEGASCMALRFSAWDMKKGQCTATITGAEESFVVTDDANGRKKNKKEGYGESLWSDHVYGDYIELVTTCRNGRVLENARVGVDTYMACTKNPIQEVEDGVSLAEPHGQGRKRGRRMVRTRKATVCGEDNRENAVCLKPSDYVPPGPEASVVMPPSTEYEASRAVARLVIGSNKACTGFLVSDKSRLLITNRHCIKKNGMSLEERTLDVETEFMAERGSCDAEWDQAMWGKSHPDYVHCQKGSAELLMSHYKLDFAIMKLNESMCVDKDGNNAVGANITLTGLFGYIPVLNSADEAGESVQEDEIAYISQHPRAYPKVVAHKTDSSSPGSTSMPHCSIESLSETSCISNSAPKSLGYSCDTQGGSSGSPVILPGRGHKAVGLHSCGGGSSCGTSDYLNSAVKFSEICDEICSNRAYLCDVVCRNNTYLP